MQVNFENLIQALAGYQTQSAIYIALWVLFGLALALSLREILAWYLKLNRLEQRLSKISADIEDIQLSLSQILASQSQNKKKPLDLINPKQQENVEAGPTSMTKPESDNKFSLSH